MSRELLQKALNKTNEMEEKKLKKQKLAENLGTILGMIVSICFDATFVWLIIKFMIGSASFTWLGALGVILLANLVYGKFK